MPAKTFSDYKETIDWLYNLHLFGIKFGLDKVQKLMEYLDNPQDKLKIIHVGGTNGKGSVCSMLASMLSEAGYSVGLNTSPHLSDFTERIQINGEQITKQEVIKYANRLAEIREQVNSETEYGNATYFEVVTAMALLYFYDKKVDYVILEVGLGGSLDATNVVKPLITIITDIALDHTEHLGDTLTSVAENKAGIIKPGVPVITSNAHPEVIDLLFNTCQKRNSPLVQVGKEIDFMIKKSNLEGINFYYHGLNSNYSDLQIPLMGDFQCVNASLALGALELLEKMEGLKISEDAVRTGLLKTRWPGRLEIIQDSPTVLLDGAHNPAGAHELRNALDMFDYNNLSLVFGCSEEKDIKGLLNGLLLLTSKIYITQADIRRAAEPDLILEQIKDYPVEKTVIKPVSAAVKTAIEQAEEDDLVCICGSLFVVGEARELWSKVKKGSDSNLPRIHY
jgi:dihydrofolate synthase/folylpolyglutamate synthase